MLVSPDSNWLTHGELTSHSMLERADFTEKLNQSRKAWYFQTKTRGRGEKFLNSANALKTGNASRITQAPTRNSEGKVGQASEIFLFFE